MRWGDHKKRVLLLLGALVAFFVATSFSLQSIFQYYIPLLERAISGIGNWAPAFFVGLAALSVLFGPFSSVFLVPLAVAVWGTNTAFGLLLGGWLAGGILAYGIGYSLGYALVVRIVSRRKVDKWLHEISAHATFMLAFLFRLAMPAETGYVFGITRYHFGKYLAIIFLAEIPFAFMVIYASDAFLSEDFFSFLGWIVFGLLVITLAVFQMRSRIR